MGTRIDLNYQFVKEGFHSINVPSEWGQTVESFSSANYVVSIQLMSPASGDSPVWSSRAGMVLFSFHSINVPSEWGLLSYFIEGVTVT